MAWQTDVLSFNSPWVSNANLHFSSFGVVSQSAMQLDFPSRCPKYNLAFYVMKLVWGSAGLAWQAFHIYSSGVHNMTPFLLRIVFTFTIVSWNCAFNYRNFIQGSIPLYEFKSYLIYIIHQVSGLFPCHYWFLIKIKCCVTGSNMSAVSFFVWHNLSPAQLNLMIFKQWSHIVYTLLNQNL